MFRTDDKILPGVVAGGVPVGGMSPEEAEKVLYEQLSPLLKGNLQLEVGDRHWEIPLEKIGAYFNYRGTASIAFSLGKSYSLARNITDQLRARAGTVDVPIQLKLNEEALRNELTAINKEYTVNERNARIVIEGENVATIPNMEGRTLDLDRILEAVSSLTPGEEFKVVADPVILTPTIREEDLAGMTVVLGRYTTQFEPGLAGEMVNMANLIDARVVKPGEIFSFNSVIDSQPGLDGGVMNQVATTLYGAVLYSGLEVIERHRNARPTGYASPGLDAFVAAGEKDLRFKNTFNFPICTAYMVDPGQGSITVFIVGQKKSNLTYRIDVKTRSTSPGVVIKSNPDLPPGTVRVISEGSPGVRAQVYRVSVDEAGNERREMISDDQYQMERKVVEVSFVNR
ncbi:MAG: VanW family protein [Bacillota bacterium]